MPDNYLAILHDAALAVKSEAECLDEFAKHDERFLIGFELFEFASDIVLLFSEGDRENAFNRMLALQEYLSWKLNEQRS